jgi:mannose/fructose-specific phosphotransferase system component IIA
MGLQDLNTLLTTGQQQQRQTQAELDAQRANQMQAALQPFQQLAFASDIITGAPSGQMSTMTQPGPSVGSQLLGLGLAAPSLVSSYQTLRGA